MRILVLLRDTFPLFRPDVVVLFGKYLPRFGISSDVSCQRLRAGGEPPADWSAGEAFVCRRFGSRLISQIAALVHDVRTLWRARKIDYAVIQARDKILTGLIALLAARMQRRRFVYWMSFPMPEGDLMRASVGGRALGIVRLCLTWLRGHVNWWLLYRMLLPRADHVFVQSDRMLEDVAAIGIRRSKLSAVPMGVDVEAVARQSSKPTKDARLLGRRVIVYLGALERARRIDFLIDMLSRIKATVPNVLLVLVGDSYEPADRRWLAQVIRAARVDDLVLQTGWLPMHLAWEYVKAAELGLSPIPPGPLFDCSSPTKAVEYMALGVPVVGSDLPDQRRVITESGAGVCVPYEVQAFADAVVGLLGDRVLATAMGARGPDYVAAARSYGVLSSEVAATFARVCGSPAAKVERA